MDRQAERTDTGPGSPAGNSPGLTRRGFLARGTVAVAGGAALAAALSPLKDLKPEDLPSLEKFLQKHYKEMTPEEKRQALDRITREVEALYLNGPAGGGGATQSVREVIAADAVLIPREWVQTQVEVLA